MGRKIALAPRKTCENFGLLSKLDIRKVKLKVFGRNVYDK